MVETPLMVSGVMLRVTVAVPAPLSTSYVQLALTGRGKYGADGNGTSIASLEMRDIPIANRVRRVLLMILV
jgi:hypothetical protein